MFFFFSFRSILWIYLLAAVLPAAILLRYIYRQDTVEKEPLSLLMQLLFCGILAAFAAVILEIIGENILNSYVTGDSPYYTILFAFLVVAAAEEGAKLFFLKKRSWADPNFNYLFDGIVYAVFVSLGFAAFENIIYVFEYGLSVAGPRALLAVPGHMAFAVYMGIFYGRAKLYENEGNFPGKKRSLIAGYLIAVFLHGFYDACAMAGTDMASLCFLIFVIVMYVITWRQIKKSSLGDRAI